MTTMLLGGLVATACSSSPSAGSSTTTTKLPDLNAQMLTSADMPTSGWTVDHSTSNTKVTGCTLPNATHHDLEKLEVDLMAPGGFPEWEEQLVDDAPGVAAKDLSTGITTLSHCSTLKFTGSGFDISATITSLGSAPQVGSGPAAWTITAPYQGQTITFFIEATVFDSEGAFFLYGELGNSETDFDTLVQKAAGKITGTGSTTGTTGSSGTGATGATGTTGTSSTSGATGTTGTTGSGNTGT